LLTRITAGHLGEITPLTFVSFGSSNSQLPVSLTLHVGNSESILRGRKYLCFENAFPLAKEVHNRRGEVHNVWQNIRWCAMK